MPELSDLENMEFDDPELEPTILPLDARLALRGSSDEFRSIFDRLGSVASQKEKIPGTSLVQITAGSESVRFTATDGTQTLVLESTTLRVLREGKALVSAHKFKSIFALAPEPSLTLTVLSDTASVVSGRAVWNLSLITSEKLPPLPSLEGLTLHTVPRRSLFKALNAVKRGLPSSGSRKSLEQANVVAGSVTTSDGYRLLRQKIEGFPPELSFSIPQASVEEFVRALAAGSEEHVRVGANNDVVVLRDVGEALIVRQLTLDFPDLESQLLAPALTNDHAMIVDSFELRDLVKRVRVAADPEYASVTLRFAQTKGSASEWELTVLTRDRSGNSASESMFALWEGQAAPFDVTLNHKFLLDLIEAYSGRLATIRVGAGSRGKSAPVLLQDEERGFVGVVQQAVSR